MTVRHHRQIGRYFITAVCQSDCMLNIFNNATRIHGIGFWDIQFSSNCPFALKIHIMIENMLKNRCVMFCRISLGKFEIIPLKSCASFLHHPIYYFMNEPNDKEADERGHVYWDARNKNGFEFPSIYAS